MVSVILASILIVATVVVIGHPFDVKSGPQPQSYPVDELMLGKYELTSDPSEHAFREYLNNMHVSKEYQEILTKLKLNVEISKTGTVYHYKVVTPFIQKEFSFVPEQEVENTYIDGRKYKSKFEFQGRDLVKHHMTFPGATSVNKYVFTKDGMTAHLMFKDKVVLRKYKRVQKFSA